MSVVEVIFTHAERRPDAIAIYDGRDPITYLQFANRIAGTASVLAADVSSGNTVVIVASNTFSFLCLYFACHYLGVTAVILAEDVTPAHRSFVVRKTKPVLTIDNSDIFIRGTMDFLLNCPKLNVSAETADIVFTSGTTGVPKGVVFNHQQIISATRHIVNQVGNTADDIELLLMPLGHSFGMARMRSTFYAGGTLVLGYQLRQLKNVYKAMKELKVTGIGLVPAAWSFMKQISKDYIKNFASQLNYIELGSAHLPVEEKKILTEWFPETRVIMHYGLTEVSRAIFLNLHEDDLSAVGREGRGASFTILREDGSSADEGELGEIAFKSDWMIREYYDHNDITSETFLEGFFKTGDIGKRELNHLYLTGRSKEMINVGGKKVNPLEVEAVLNTHDSVAESACVGFQDVVSGELVQAFIVLNPDCEAGTTDIEAELRRTVSFRLPVYMRPRKYRYVSHLPKTTTGKIQRLALGLE